MLSGKSKHHFNFFLMAGVSDSPWNSFEENGVLGYGTNAVVFRVRSRRDGKEYALKKTYRPPTFKEIKHCKREIEEYSKLVNPHVARYQNISRCAGQDLYSDGTLWRGPWKVLRGQCINRK